MTLFRHPEDRIPVLLFACVFALDLTVYFTAQSWWLPILWFGVMIIPKGWISAWNHHHQHLPMFRHAVPNRLLEIVFGFQTRMNRIRQTIELIAAMTSTSSGPM